MNRKELIAEIVSDLKQYEESNLIDYRSLNLNIKSSIKRFGNNIMIPSEKFIRISGGQADLPLNFWKLDLAVKCSPLGYSVEEGDPTNLITSTTYRQRTEQSVEWNNQIETYVNKDFKQITEKIYTDKNVLNYHYSNPIVLKLTRGMKKESCLAGCKNLQNIFTHNSPWEINILNEKIQTNFEEGYIYIQYAGIPVDEDGDLLIPDTQHDHLQNYIIYHCKARVIERLMGNGDDTDLINMYKIYSGKESEYFSLAMTETKMEGLGHDWDKKMKNKMRRTTMMYENLFPKR